MRVTIEQAALAKVMSRAAAVAQTRGTIPILQNVRLEAEGDGRVFVTATDLDRQLREGMTGNVERPGAITVSAARLNDIAKAAPEGAEILIEHDTAKDPRAVVAFARSRYQMPVLPAEDFPLWGAIREPARLTLPAAELLRLLDRVQAAQSTDQNRYYICGTYLHALAVHGVATLRAVATDGHRASLDDFPLDRGTDMPGVIIPRETTAEFRRLLSGVRSDVTLEVSGEQVALSVGEATLSSRLIDGTYPDYARVFPRDWAAEVRVDRALLLAAVKRVSMITDIKGRPTTFSVADGVMTITARSETFGVASEQIEVAGDTDMDPRGFNARYVIDALEQTDADQVLLRVGEHPVDPCRLDPNPAAPGCKHVANVIMPLRV